MSQNVRNSSAVVQRSAVLSTFPWLTDFLLGKNKDVASDATYMPLFTTLAEFEHGIAAPLDIDAVEFRQLLLVVDEQLPDQMPTTLVKMVKPMPSKLCQLLGVYKLVDVLHSINHPVPRSASRNPRYSRMTAIGISEDNKHWPMKDWISNLQTGRSLMEALAIHQQGIPTSPSSVVEDPSSSDGMALECRLFKDLHNLSLRHGGTRLLFNVQLAAIHLFFMLKGNKEATTLALPDLPSTFELVHSSLTEEQVDFARELIRQYDAYKLRYPLHAALLISPIVLLTTKKLVSRCMQQVSLIKASKALGNCKPDLLVDVECNMWKALLSIAKGQASAYSALQEFFTMLPWDALNHVSQHDRGFFMPDAVPQKTPISLLTLENESEINEDWLLAGLRPPSGSSGSGIGPSDVPASDGAGDMDVDDPINSEPSPRRPRSRSLSHSTPSPNVINSAKAAERRLTNVGAHRRQGVTDSDMELDSDAGRNEPHQSEGEDGSRPSLLEKQRSGLRRSYRASQPTKKIQVAWGKSPAKPRRNRSQKQDRTKQYIPYQQIRPGSYLEPVDLSTYIQVEQDITFKPETLRRRVIGPECQLYSPSGDVHTWMPEFHFQTDLTGFQNFHRHVESCFVNGKPLHVSDPPRSLFAVLSNEQYSALSASEVQNILRTKHIAITGIPHQPISFDAAGLRRLKNLSATVTFQDQSVDVSDGDFGHQLCIGTLRHLVNAIRSDSGPILNALSFPFSLSGVQESPMSTEVEAWRLTEGMKFCPNEVTFPVGEMRWGLAATRGARHWIHIDSDGLGTFVDVQCGGKWWITFSPPSTQGKHAFGSIDEYIGSFDTTGGKDGRWAVGSSQESVEDRRVAEALYLTAGTRLIMRPNTPHAVFTPEHSIVFGGHYYSTSNIQDTFYAIVHCFMANGIVTNVEHCKTRRLLMRMMQYYYKCFVLGVDDDEYSCGHLPDLLESESMVDVLTLCNLCYLANVLDFRTYSFPTLADTQNPSPRDLDRRIVWDYNALTVVDRQYFTYVRGLARNLIKWISCHYDVTYAQAEGPIPNVERDFCGHYLMQQACAILNYKKKAEKEKVPGLRFCSFEDVEKQVGYLLTEDSEMWYGNWKVMRENLEQHTTLAFEDRNFTISKKDVPSKFKPVDPAKGGVTIGDKKFKTGLESGFHSTESDVRPEAHDNSESEDESTSDESMSDGASKGGDKSTSGPESEDSASSSRPTKRKRV